MKAKTDTLNITAYVTTKDIRLGGEKPYDGFKCPLARAIKRALKNNGRGWNHSWVTWADATAVKNGRWRTARIPDTEREAYHKLRPEGWGMKRNRRAIKPFMVHLSYQAPRP